MHIVLCLILDSRQNEDEPRVTANLIVLCLILDSRQNNLTMWGIPATIVLCLILDSRQNEDEPRVTANLIVLCLILDSRQNNALESPGYPVIVLCLILDSRQNWFGLEPPLPINCTVPYFGFKAKLPVSSVDSGRRLYCALFWIQGKTEKQHG